MARISTHVLDTQKGRPAAGIPVDLFFGGRLLRTLTTNADGRTNEPLLIGERIETGRYELIFHAGEYLGRDGAFFDDIAIRFVVTDGTGNYHVPLLLAAHGYTTYRGS